MEANPIPILRIEKAITIRSATGFDILKKVFKNIFFKYSQFLY